MICQQCKQRHVEKDRECYAVKVFFETFRYGIAFEAKFAYGLQYSLVSLGTTEDEAIANLKCQLKETFLALRKARHSLDMLNAHKLHLLEEYVGVEKTLS